MYSIGQFAKKTGITIRTLRYYDEKDLLKPAYISEKGQRFYDDTNILTIQKILVCKYLDYPLENIKSLLEEDTTILQSLYEQKNQLEKKRQQLDQMIASVETAIQIHEKSGEIDPTSLLVVIHSMLTIDEQKNYLKNYLSEEIIEKMYDFLGENIVELNRKYIELTHALKDAYSVPIHDEELKALMLQYFSLIPQDLLKEIAIGLAHIQIEQMDSWLFTSLFTAEEEQWIGEQMERLNMYEEFLG
jgi:DNA-binding transcriptional MerR regulator